MHNASACRSAYLYIAFIHYSYNFVWSYVFVVKFPFIRTFKKVHAVAYRKINNSLFSAVIDFRFVFALIKFCQAASWDLFIYSFNSPK